MNFVIGNSQALPSGLDFHIFLLVIILGTFYTIVKIHVGTVDQKSKHMNTLKMEDSIEVTACQCSYNMYLPNGSPSVQTVQTAQQRTTATPTGNLVIIMKKVIFIQQ